MPPKTRSYYVEYWSSNGHCLLGGVRRIESSRYQNEQDAITRAETIVELNPHADYAIHPSSLHPEIFSHCEGSIPQGIGGKCFKCGKVLTEKDAMLVNAIPHAS